MKMLTHPRMHQSLISRESHVGIQLQQFRNQVLGLGADIVPVLGMELIGPFLNLSKELRLVGVVERLA